MNGIYAQVSCSMTRDPRMIAAGWQGRAVYIEAILYCRENLTDGIIDRLAMPYWMPDMPVKARVKLLDRLVDVKALDPCEQGWRFPEHVWSRWNPSKADVEAKRESEKQRKAEYRAKRRSEPHTSGNVPTGQDDYATSRGKQPESKPEPEPEPKGNSHLSTTQQGAVDNFDDDEKFHHVVSRVVFNREQRSQPRNAGPWRAKVRTSVLDEHSDRIHDLMARYPDAPYDVIAAAVEGDTGSLRYYQPVEGSEGDVAVLVEMSSYQRNEGKPA